MSTYIVNPEGSVLWKKSGVKDGYISGGTLLNATESLVIKGRDCWKIDTGEFSGYYVEKANVTEYGTEPPPPNGDTITIPPGNLQVQTTDGKHFQNDVEITLPEIYG